jgi:hypothetical protein
MAPQTEPPSSELIDADEAARLLEVARNRIDVLVDEGLLTPAAGERARFLRSEVLALRELGG